EKINPRQELNDNPPLYLFLRLIVIKCFLLGEMTQNRKSHYSGLQGLMRRPSCSTAPTMSVGVFDCEVVPAIHGRGVQVWDVLEHNHENVLIGRNCLSTGEITFSVLIAIFGIVLFIDTKEWMRRRQLPEDSRNVYQIRFLTENIQAVKMSKRAL
ncbi:hypothetical protein HID58_082045, partial [Brassica napus]